jgi:ATP-dependent helicase Lhr and Lhr-like helicase
VARGQLDRRSVPHSDGPRLSLIGQLDQQLAEVLGRLERTEARLLTWGLVEAGFTEAEVLDRIRAVSDELDLPASDHELMSGLIDRGLLIRLQYPSGPIYRSRMAEAVRLLSHLRQLFPRHLDGQDWRWAPSLVSDFRLLLQPRYFPKRDLRIETVLASLVTDESKRPIIEAVAGQMLSGASGPRLLSRFQVAATQGILSDVGQRNSRGTIVCSGTGSGKTLAFYMPALITIAQRITPTPWTQVLAIYPRSELLKDQLTEAVKTVQKINPTLSGLGIRGVRIGAYFGLTPFSAASAQGQDGWGERAGGGLVCPFVRCPICDGDLVWSDSDREKKVERLHCTSRLCDGSTGDELVLTRSSMQGAPPDILFATTEMLNRRFTDTWSRHVFGLGKRASKKPYLVLLDEVHTYEGTHGAQVAMLMRRWRRAIGAPAHFVGLSATLKDATRFFASLTGLEQEAVREVAPLPEELDPSGMEYQLALRGDPVSGASLLSTTIQVAMLLHRVLDPQDLGRSQGLYGSRLFLFTDKLDVTNRLFWDLLDAEGRDSWGNPKPGEGSLANLRDPARDQRSERLADGQSWDASEEIGHHLGALARVGRTSSQDSGVDKDSDIIVTTPSLDVGFNDPTIGAIIQHKAPRDAAQFLQRKGRAGRAVEMRPWTVVVLSDYGRDRLAYQSYDVLFNPSLEPRYLPVGNRYIQRMQGGYATLDWLAEELERGEAIARGSVWDDLAGPSAKPDRATRQAAELRIFRDLQRHPPARSRFSRFLTEALQASKRDIESLLWEQPRALLTSLIPTATRRLATGWRARGKAGADFVAGWPLPDFLPANLFSDLALPEVHITTPAATRGAEEGDFAMPIAQALTEFAPGRVSRRYGIEHRYVRHWVEPVSTEDPVQELEVGRWITDAEGLGEVTARVAGADRAVQFIRPRTITVVRPPQAVVDSSFAAPGWQVEVVPLDHGLVADLPSPSPWEDIVTDMSFYLHRHGSGVEMRRFATESLSGLNFRDGRRVESVIRYVDDKRVPVAVGYKLEVDGVRVDFGAVGKSLPSEFEMSCRGPGARVAWFRHAIMTTDRLDGIASSFDREWLSQIFLSAVSAAALHDSISLEDATAAIIRIGIGGELVRCLNVIFQTLPGIEDQEGRAPRLHERLSELCVDGRVEAVLTDLAPALWIEPTDDAAYWFADRLAATLGAAILDASQQLCPDIDVSELQVDILARRDVADGLGPREVWISEGIPGGGGILERVFDRYCEDPRRFFRLVDGALQPADAELVDRELTQILEWLEVDSELVELVSAVRASSNRSFARVENSFANLRTALAKRGSLVCHPVIAALAARILRPASDPAIDQMMLALLRRWTLAEDRLGIELDARVIAYVAARDNLDDVKAALAASGLEPEGDPVSWLFSVISSLIWPRGWQLRAASLLAPNPFRRHPPTVPDALSAMLHRSRPTPIDAENREWLSDLSESLRTTGIGSLSMGRAGNRVLRERILAAVSAPVDMGHIHLYPRVAGVARVRDGIIVHFDLPESFQ